jgi:hypothetical protein
MAFNSLLLNPVASTASKGILLAAVLAGMLPKACQSLLLGGLLVYET